MKKSEASFLLLVITFFAAIQYPFLSGVPDSVSHFAFLCITNLIGFLIALAIFFSELFRLDKKQVKQCFFLSAELFGFNVFLLFGSSGVSATVSACVLSAYFIFVPIFSLIFLKQKIDKNSIIASVVVIIGLFLMMNADVKGLADIHILYLLIADMFFAVYIITAGRFTMGSNPAILAMGQMFFNALISFVFWAGESVITKTPISLPTDAAFWGSVIFISFFIRGLYSIIQIYAQRYVSPLNTSLIFSTEIVMTMAMSPVLAALFGTEPEVITPMRIVGAFVMVLGILLADSTVTDSLTINRVRVGKKATVKTLVIGFICAFVYLVLDLPIQLTGFLTFGSYIGIKNFLPILLGLQFGPGGILGALAGFLISALTLATPIREVLLEACCIIIPGLIAWLGWHIGSKDNRIRFHSALSYGKYLLIVLVSYCICGGISYLLIDGGDFATILVSYTLFSVLVGLPVLVILNSIMCIEPVLPFGRTVKYDVQVDVTAAPGRLDQFNDAVEEAGMQKQMNRKSIFEVENCMEELFIRIFKADPDATIEAMLSFDGTISAVLQVTGPKYNPLSTSKDEDELDIISLKLIKHRALRASYRYSFGTNQIHIVI